MRLMLDFHPHLAVLLPQTYAILKSANLTVHASVTRIILHGSRGPANCHRGDSDIDLSLIVDVPPDDVDLLRDIYETTCRHWKSSIELDLAVVFDQRQCGLKCFDEAAWNAHLCKIGGTDCFGLYKIGKGFNGLVTNAGVQVKRMYPCLKIWARG